MHGIHVWRYEGCFPGKGEVTCLWYAVASFHPFHTGPQCPGRRWRMISFWLRHLCAKKGVSMAESTFPLGHFESQRLLSFGEWPPSSPVSPNDLASAGFYAVQDGGSTVRCFCCGLEVDRWSPGDRPADIHRRLGETCDFMAGRKTRNVSLLEEEKELDPEVHCEDDDHCEDDEEEDDVPHYPTTAPEICPSVDDNEPDGDSDFCLDDDTVDIMADEDMRRSTFVAAHWPSNSPVSPPDLAAAGFYYVGIGDRVRCFSCGGCVHRWEHGDCPLTEHRRLFPHCAFLKTHLRDAGQVLYDPSDQSFVDRFEACPRMNEEAARLTTFEDWPAPARSIVLPAALARAGFYYTGSSDTVRCAFCKVYIRHWEPGDLAFRRHRRQSPGCTLVLRTCTSNIPLPDGPQHDPEDDHVKDMHFEALRLATFSTWPAQLAISASELASAGFFYAGVGDRVRCFACGGILFDWEPGQAAIQRHGECFPDCLFVRGHQHNNVPVPGPPPLAEHELQQMRSEKVRMQSFATWPRHAVITGDELAEAGFYYTNHGDIMRCFCCHVELSHWKMWHTAWGRHRQVNSSCLYVQQSCPADPDVYAATFYRNRSHSGTTASSTPFSSMMASSTTDNSLSSSHNSSLSHNARMSPSSAHAVRHPGPLAATLPTPGSQPMYENVLPRYESVPVLNRDDSEENDLRTELQQLRDSHLCKVCMERDMSQLFMPCGHLVCCDACSKTVGTCPVCREAISDSVRVFLT